SLVLRPPPPSSPLFPYTTLFRSCRAPGGAGRDCALADGHATVDAAEVQEEEGVISDLADQLVAPSAHRILDDLIRRRENRLRGIDRKSTRLNSSHVKISYAVFCL